MWNLQSKTLLKMKPLLTGVILSFILISCNTEEEEMPLGFYGIPCPDADYTVKVIPNKLSLMIREELMSKITNDSIIGKIPYSVSHPVSVPDCLTKYDEYRVTALVKLSSSEETWDLSFRKRKNGQLWCEYCLRVSTE